MTVGELIARLKEYGPELMVVVDCEYGGVDELTEVRGVHVALEHGRMGLGRHAIVDPTEWDFEDEYGKATVVAALHLLHSG